MAVLPPFVARRLQPEARFGLRLTLFGLALVVVAVPFSYLMFEVMRKGPLTRFDESTANRMHEHVVGNPALIDALNGISWLGKPLLLGMCIAAGAIYVYRRGRQRLALFLAATSIGGGLVDSAVKIFVDRPRPKLDTPIAHAFGKSFPSGHAMSSTVTYGALLLVFLPALPRRWRWAGWVGTTSLIVGICLSRLLLGVHFVTDVVGGVVLGLAWVAGSAAMFEIWRAEAGKEKANVATEGLEPEAADDLTTAGTPPSGHGTV
ncbi:MAG TPA: phosphatase PAP2 family protein [Acidimicrobiales bacterium]|nr:phosphatase PAP2 family protein [Acidimicrobiales bacterium]